MRLLLTITFGLLLANCFCQTTLVTGYVLDLATKAPLAGAKVDLQRKDDGGTIDSLVTDSSGSFSFKSIKAGKYLLTCFYAMTGPQMFPIAFKNVIIGRFDIDSNVVVENGGTYTHRFYMPVTCTYDKTKDQDYCPVCLKKDMVQPILWGLPVFDKDGNWSRDGKSLDDFYTGGCEPDIWCNPTRHCNRCNIGF